MSTFFHRVFFGAALVASLGPVARADDAPPPPPPPSSPTAPDSAPPAPDAPAAPAAGASVAEPVAPLPSAAPAPAPTVVPVPTEPVRVAPRPLTPVIVVPPMAAPLTSVTVCPEPCAPPSCGCDPLLGCGPTREVGDVYGMFGGSVLPNGGFYAGAGQVIASNSCAVWSVELIGTYQFIDEKTFVDDGNRPAGDWLEFQAGVAVRTHPEARRHAVFRGGAFFFHADGEPNLIDVNGDWAGVYVGAGFETDFSDNLSVGPAITLLAGVPIDGGQDYSLVPQLSWGLTWWTGPTCPRNADACPCRPLGEFYVETFASAVPGIGGGFGMGQVFARTDRIVWSFEAAATYQSVDEAAIFGEGSGEFARVSTGVKALFSPEACAHLALRAGSTWLRTTGPTEFVDLPADYFGVYASVGYEFDLGERFSTGPEAGVIVVNREGKGSTIEALPLLAWRLTLKL